MKKDEQPSTSSTSGPTPGTSNISSKDKQTEFLNILSTLDLFYFIDVKINQQRKATSKQVAVLLRNSMSQIYRALKDHLLLN